MRAPRLGLLVLPQGESRTCTVQYRMIHPFHAGNMVAKMPKVGTVSDYRMDYTFGSDFEVELKAAVAKVVKPSERFATPGFWFRLVCYISLYLACLVTYVTHGSSWALCTVFGAFIRLTVAAFIGLNVQHDGNHGAISPNPALNELFGFGADMIGGAKYLWLQQHWTHHAFTNDVTRDPDSSSADPFFLFHNYPKDSPLRQAISDI
ncbi:fatty acid desaturase-domain-containing protein [Baffinella frigidus]|nr:fatty acid desaturase-domain-containing protein [Cryptophyta sp. CCMP2293]